MRVETQVVEKIVEVEKVVEREVPKAETKIVVREVEVPGKGPADRFCLSTARHLVLVVFSGSSGGLVCTCGRSCALITRDTRRSGDQGAVSR